MRRLSTLLLAITLPAALSAQQPTTPQPNPVTASFRGRTMSLQRNIAQAFDSIPESMFGYRPTPTQLTVGNVAQHLANDNYFYCGNFGDMKPTRSAEEMATPDSVKATWPKAALVKNLKESLAFCESAFTQLDDAKLAEGFTMTFGANSRPSTRAAMALGHAIDLADHYSQIANYMRLNNMLPPTALPRPAR